MKHFIHIVIIAVVFLVTFAKAEVIKEGSFQAISDGVNVTLHWFTLDESNIARYEIERRAGIDGEFTLVGTASPKGPSLYDFVDYSAFRKTAGVYQYRIKITFANNSVLFSNAVTVTHTVSGIRRTWGSLKAMFR